MRTIIVIIAITHLGCLLNAQQGERNVYDEVDWKYGPTTGRLGYIAEIDVPKGYLFAGSRDTLKLMEAFENPTSGTELGFLAPDTMEWFVVFDFEEIGYVPDDEKDDLDADVILESLKEGTSQGNKIRRQKGWGTLEIVGWQKKPFYNERSHNVEWAPKAVDEEGSYIVNYNSRILGRKGVMSATLIVAPVQLPSVLPSYQSCLQGFRYKAGEKYSEFKEGDKTAEWGLIGLITGGTIAVAAKTGFLAKFWKILIIPVIAVGVFLKKIFGGGK
jgi:uncharacterized membrane-anchored protein